MTLTDTHDLRERLIACQTAAEVAAVLEEYGEDCTPEEVAVIFDRLNAEDSFVYGEQAATLYGKTISCPHCHNTAPDTILVSSTELLCGDKATHFGCCSCGTQFTVG